KAAMSYKNSGLRCSQQPVILRPQIFPHRLHRSGKVHGSARCARSATGHGARWQNSKPRWSGGYGSRRDDEAAVSVANLTKLELLEQQRTGHTAVTPFGREFLRVVLR